MLPWLLTSAGWALDPPCRPRDRCEPICPPDSELRGVDGLDVCLAGNVRQGPFRYWKAGSLQLEGEWEDDVPAGIWKRYRGGRLRARSSPPIDTLRDCDPSPDCWLEAAITALDALKRRSKDLAEPAVVFDRDAARIGGVDGRGFYLDFRSLFVVGDTSRQSVGMSLGPTAAFTRDGRPAVSLLNDTRGDLTGTITVFDVVKRKVARKASFEGGLLHGQELTFWEDGSRRCETTWVHGQLHGWIRCWNEEGVQEVQGGFDKGTPCSPFAIRDMQAPTFASCRF